MRKKQTPNRKNAKHVVTMTYDSDLKYLYSVECQSDEIYFQCKCCRERKLCKFNEAYQRFLLTGIQPSFWVARQRRVPTAPVKTDQANQRTMRDFQSLKIKSVMPACAPIKTWKVHNMEPADAFAYTTTTHYHIMSVYTVTDDIFTQNNRGWFFE